MKWLGLQWIVIYIILSPEFFTIFPGIVFPYLYSWLLVHNMGAVICDNDFILNEHTMEHTICYINILCNVTITERIR